MDETPLKIVVWVGPTRKELKEFPRPVQRVFGYALNAVQMGEVPPEAKVLKGFGGGAGVLELVEDHRGDTYREFTCCMCFRRNRNAASPRRRKTSI
jgi:phage-related protein